MTKEKQVCRMEGRKYELTQGADRLKAIFEAQRAFSKRMGFDFTKMTDLQRQARIKDLVLFAKVEQSEVLDWINWKDWKKEKREFNKEQAMFEVIDTLCFLLQEVMCCGMDDEDLFQYFMRKVEINHERQDKNY